MRTVRSSGGGSLDERREAGFTLMEIMVVVAIMGVLGAMAAYNFRTETNFFAADKALFRDSLVRARDMARGRVNCVVVTVDNATQSMTLTARDAGPGKDCVAFGAVTVAIPPIKFSAIATFSDFSSGGTSLTFNTDGGLVVGVPVTIQLVHPDRSATAKIYPAIGQIRVQ